MHFTKLRLLVCAERIEGPDRRQEGEAGGYYSTGQDNVGAGTGAGALEAS